MAQTGCDGVEMGAESGADVILKTLKKHFKAEHITRAYGMFKERGIKVEVCIFVGTPGETRESILESFDFLERLVPDAEGCHDRVTINFGYRIFKNTWLHRVAIGEGVVREGDDLAFPRYYVAPSVLGDDSLLDLIQDRVVSKRNWYLWWGLPRYSLKDRVREAEREIAKMQALYEQATEQCPIVPAR
jgi:radical SAM superfamily enzyme YgiQ (UPF0313 family)